MRGFLGGQLWLLYKHSGDPFWREQAEHYSRLVEHRKTDRNVHDLGFVFWSTWKRWYDLTGDAAVNEVVVQAGQTLALRFKEKGQYLRSFVADDSLFIDIMMNVGIIFYAAQQTGDDNLWRIANQHCLTTRKLPGARRRQHIARGPVRPGHRPVFQAEHAPGLARRFVVGARADVGALWLWHGLPLYRRCALFADGERRAPISTSSTRRLTACRPMIGMNPIRPSLREFGGGHCGQRAAATGAAYGRRGAGARSIATMRCRFWTR